MTVKEFVGAQETTVDPIKFNIIAPNANGATEKLTVDNYATFAPMEVLAWMASATERYIDLFVGYAED